MAIESSHYGIPKFIVKLVVFQYYAMEKQMRESILKKSHIRNTQILKLIHANICDCLLVSLIERNIFFLLLINNCSRKI